MSLENAREVSPRLRDFIVSPNDFDLVKEIGVGAFGKVYLGIHRQKGIECAVKQLLVDHLDGRDRVDFFREISVMAECQDMFLLPFMGWSPTPPYYIVTQFAPNGSLFDALHRKSGAPELSPTTKTKIMIGTAYGMLALHKKKVIHRDLKSLNVLLDANMFPWVCDFGLSRFTNDEDDLKTQDIGTPHWMAPELFNSANYTDKVDVYAYGMLLWEILTGATPYKGMTPMQIALAVVQRGERPAFPPGTSRDIAAFISMCWHQNPAKRPSFKQIVEVFEQKKIVFKGTDMNSLNIFLNTVKDYYSNQRHSSYKSKHSHSSRSEYNGEPNPNELGNPNFRFYEQNFNACLKVYSTPEHLPAFFNSLVPCVDRTAPDDIAKFVLGNCVKIVSKDQNGFNAFFASKLFASLPNVRSCCDSHILKLLNIYFTQRPDLLTESFLDSYAKFAETHPRQMLHLISLALNRFGQFSNGWEVSNFAVRVAPHFLKADCAPEYLQLLGSMLSNEVWRGEYLNTCAAVLVSSLSVCSPALSKMAFSIILATPGMPAVPADAVNASLRTGCEEGAIAYLMKSGTFSPTAETADALFTASQKNKDAFALLLKYAERSDAFTLFFPEYQGVWLLDGRVTFERSSQIVCVLLTQEALKPYIGLVAQIPSWLRALAESGQETYAGVSALVVTKIGISEQLVRSLINAGFFPAFAAAVGAAKSAQLNQSALFLIDSVSRLAFIDAFVALLPLMLSLITTQDRLAIAAVSALASLSMHERAAAALRGAVDCRALVAAVKKVNGSEPYVPILKKNLM